MMDPGALIVECSHPAAINGILDLCTQAAALTSKSWTIRSLASMVRMSERFETLWQQGGEEVVERIREKTPQEHNDKLNRKKRRRNWPIVTH